jgi:hypothetical protein
MKKMAMKIKEAFTFDNGKWIAELSTLQCHKGRLRLQNGKEYANVQAFIKACTPHYSEDEDCELTHWTYRTKTQKVIIFND